jgi:hypothetical protein
VEAEEHLMPLLQVVVDLVVEVQTLVPEHQEQPIKVLMVETLTVTPMVEAEELVEQLMT